MKLVTLSGGIGNQMFQYAFYLALKTTDPHVYLYKNKIIRYNEHTGYELQRLFGVENQLNGLWLTRLLQIKGLGSVVKHLLFPRKIRERKIYDFNAYGEWLDRKPGYGLHLVGYWQSERYFARVADIVRKTFIFDDRMTNAQTRRLLETRSERPTVSVHIRRGDYLKGNNATLYGNICTPDYYARAIAYMTERLDDPVFYVFSDDLDYVRTHISIPQPPHTVFVDWNRGQDSWQDLLLMSRCQHNILANSSFSWWGGWLNANPDKIVITPKNWINGMSAPDVTPSIWIRL